jgi:DUF1009 family protein
MSLIVGNEEMNRVLDAANSFLDQLDDESMVIKVYGALAKIFSSMGVKHPLFHGLISKMKMEIRSKSLTIRKRSLSVFKILSKYLSNDEAIWSCLLYLADPDEGVKIQSDFDSR